MIKTGQILGYITAKSLGINPTVLNGSYVEGRLTVKAAFVRAIKDLKILKPSATGKTDTARSYSSERKGDFVQVFVFVYHMYTSLKLIAVFIK